MKIYKNILFLLLSILFSQNWHPYHNIELNNHRNLFVDYERIDSLARMQNMPENSFRENLSHEVIGYLPYWEYEHYTDLNYDLLTQINYFSAELDPYGNIINSHNWNNLYLIEYAHARNVKVKLCATLFGQSDLSTLLSSPLNRSNAISNLLNLVSSRNADGIDIDFELLPYSQRENLVLFMNELSTAFHNEMDDPIITMATPAVDWSNAWDYNALAQLTDGLFVMGYNYFYSGSSMAGPVSPLGGYTYDIEYTINDYINKTNGQLDKIILGLPYYGYDWPVENSNINSNTTGNGSARIYSDASMMSQNYGNLWDASSSSVWFTYQQSNWQQCWYDDSLSLSNKYQFAIDRNLSGVGIWALGYDNGNNELWGALSDKFFNSNLGDFNNDGFANVIDVIILVNIVLGIDDASADVDLTDDGQVNILDIVYLVMMILNYE